MATDPTESNSPSPIDPNSLSTLEKIEKSIANIARLADEVNIQAERSLISYKAQAKSLEDQIISLQGKTDAESKYYALLYERQKREALIAANEQKRIIAVSQIQQIEQQLTANGKQLTDLSQQELDQLIKKREELVDITTELEKQRKDLKEFNTQQESAFKLAEKRLDIQQRQKVLFEQQGIALFNQIGTTSHLSDIMEAFLAGPMSALTQVLSRQITESIKLIDVVMSGNQQFTSMTGQIAQRSLSFGYGMSQFGVGFQQMNEAMMGLYTSMSGFTDQTQEVQEQLAGTAAKMKNLGVDIATTGKNFDILTKSLKMSAETAIDTEDKIAKAAIGAGIAPSVMLKEFANNMPRLAAYGQQAVDIFIKLEKQAKSLGMTVQELNGIVGEQYDTFDGAATGAGKLNAILGGNYLNSIQMMNANESERIMIIKRAVDASGLQIDGMHKFQQIAIANAMGIKDLTQLNNLLGKSTTQLTIDLEKEAASQKELEAVQREAAEVQKQMTAAFQSLLIVIKPLVDIIKGIVNIIAEFMDLGNGLAGQITTWTLIFVYFGSKIKLVADYFKGLSFFTKLFGTTAAKTTVAAAGLPVVVEETGVAGSTASPGIMALSASILELGAAIALVGIGIGVAAAGIGYLVNSFKGLGDSTATAAVGVALFVVVFAGMVYALNLMLPAIASAGTGVLYFAGGVALLGLGVGLAAVGFGYLVESVGKLSSTLTAEAATNLMNISKAIASLVLVLAGTGTMGIIGITVGSIALASSLARIISSVNNIQADKMSNFSSMLKTLAETLRLNGIETVSVQIANAINNISAAIDKVPENKSVNFTSTMDSINRTFSSMAQVDSTKLDSAKQFVDTATKYYTVQKDSKGADNDALVAALAKAIGGLSGGKGGSGGAENIVIKLEVDGQKMAEVVQKINEKKPLTGKVTY